MDTEVGECWEMANVMRVEMREFEHLHRGTENNFKSFISLQKH